MIAGSFIPLGIKQGSSLIQQKPMVFDRGFSNHLRTAAKEPYATRETEKREGIWEKDNQAREAYGKKSGPPEKTPAENISEAEGSVLAPQAGVVFTYPDPLPEDPLVPTEDPALSSLVLTEQKADGLIADPMGRPGGIAGLGQSTYRNSAHGPQEALHAEAAGAKPPITGLPGLPESLDDFADVTAKAAAFKDATHQVGSSQTDKNYSAIEILRMARNAATAPEGTDLSATVPDSAQARNKAMMEIMEEISPDAKNVLGSTSQTKNGAVTTSQAFSSFSGNTGGEMTQNFMNSGANDDSGPGPKTASTAFQFADELPSPLSARFPAAGLDAVRTPQTLAQPESALMERIADQAKWLIKNNRNEVTMKLAPEHLGDLQMKVIQEKGTLRVEMTVENLEAKKVLESQVEEIHQKLVEENLADSQFQFDVNVRQNHDPQRPRDLSLRPPSQSAMADWANPDQVTKTSEQAKPVWGHEGVGVYA